MKHYDRIRKALETNTSKRSDVKVLTLSGNKYTSNYNSPITQEVTEFEHDELNKLITNSIRCTWPNIGMPSTIDYDQTIAGVADSLMQRLINSVSDLKLRKKLLKKYRRAVGDKKEFINYAIEVLFVQNLEPPMKQMLINNIIQKYNV